MNVRDFGASVGLGLLLLGCASDDAGPGEADTDTDGSMETSTTGASTSASSASTTGDASDGTTGDPTDPTQGEGSTGEGSTGEVVGDPGPYRIVYTSADSGITRLYSATDDFAEVETLTSAGAEPVDMSSYARRPRLHADARHLFYARGPAATVLDVFTGEETALLIDATEIEQRDWSPTGLEMSILDSNRQLRRVAADGSDDNTLIHDFTGDGEPTASLEISWSPLGDRLAVRSRPDGGARVLWMVDAEGQDAEPVFQPNSPVSPLYGWTVDGQSVWWVADASPEIVGSELGIGNPAGFTLLSEGQANVEPWAAYAADGSRFVFLADAGVVSVLPDGNGQTLVGPTVAQDASTDLELNDDGTFYALEEDGRLIVGAAGMYNFLEIHPSGVDNPKFVPGGSRLAYTHRVDQEAPRRLFLLDGNGANEVSVELAVGEQVADFGWFQDGVLYLLATQDGHTGLFHTDAGDTPLFVPEDGETLSLAISEDENRMVIKAVMGGVTGRLCSFDTTDMTSVIDLGCIDYTISEGSGSTVMVAYEGQ
jgi:hypothetical protein